MPESGVEPARQAGFERANFSCSAEAWSSAKLAWAKERRTYPAWAKWLEAAFDEKARRTRKRLGVEDLEPAPDRLPPGRRAPSDNPEIRGRPRRSFSCSPQIWQQARAAWWAEAELYPALSDWAEEAVREKIDASVEPTGKASKSPRKAASKTR